MKIEEYNTTKYKNLIRQITDYKISFIKFKKQVELIVLKLKDRFTTKLDGTAEDFNFNLNIIKLMNNIISSTLSGNCGGPIIINTKHIYSGQRNIYIEMYRDGQNDRFYKKKEISSICKMFYLTFHEPTVGISNYIHYKFNRNICNNFNPNMCNITYTKNIYLSPTATNYYTIEPVTIPSSMYGAPPLTGYNLHLNGTTSTNSLFHQQLQHSFTVPNFGYSDLNGQFKNHIFYFVRANNTLSHVLESQKQMEFQTKPLVENIEIKEKKSTSRTLSGTVDINRFAPEVTSESTVPLVPRVKISPMGLVPSMEPAEPIEPFLTQSVKEFFILFYNFVTLYDLITEMDLLNLKNNVSIIDQLFKHIKTFNTKSQLSINFEQVIKNTDNVQQSLIALISSQKDNIIKNAEEQTKNECDSINAEFEKLYPPLEKEQVENKEMNTEEQKYLKYKAKYLKLKEMIKNMKI